MSFIAAGEMLPPSEVNRDAVLYAHWKATTGISLPDPGTKEGYRFDGWYEDGRRVGGIGTNYSPISNVTLVARWSEN